MSDTTQLESMLETVLAQNKALAEQNAALATRLSTMESRLPQAEPEAVPAGTFLEFPRVIYRRTDAATIDHPGNEARTVATAAECEAALAEGDWSLTPHAPAEPAAPPKSSAKKK